jgi:glycosyltransferase involved in cell wall biosynthesis
LKLSVVIPVYNEVATILELVEKVVDGCKAVSDLVSEFEMVMVDDGSKDGTRALLTQHLSNHPNIRIFLQEVNQGKGAAIKMGFSKTTGDVVLVQDADLEYDPSDYRQLLKPIVDGKADVVFGSRFKGDTSRVLYFYHFLGNQFLTFVSNCFTNLNLTDMETCYKVFKGPVIRSMLLSANRFGIEPEMTAKISKIRGLRIYEVPVSYFGRTYEEGKKIGWKDGVSAIWCILKYNLLTNFSESFSIESEKILADCRRIGLKPRSVLSSAGQSQPEELPLSGTNLTGASPGASAHSWPLTVPGPRP